MSAETQQPTSVPDPLIPWLRFPPFPKPPQGVTIIPFKHFKPAGMPLRFDDMDNENQVEYDAAGIPTVPLKVKHSLTEEEQKRKKKKRKTASSRGGVLKKLMWYEEWEDGETFRRMTSDVNPALSRVDRLHQAFQDFKAGRAWPPTTSGVMQLWDAFRLYVGIISSIQPPPSKRRQPQQPDGDEDEDEDIDQPAAATPEVLVMDDAEARELDEQKLKAQAEERRKNRNEEAQARFERKLEAKDSRMDFFLNDPELSMKIFFSAHYRDKGLIWDEARCRDGPILVEFFFRFLIRNQVLPDYEKGLRKGLDVVLIARKELPLTFVVGRALSDKFSRGCEKLFGGMTQAMYWQEDNSDVEMQDANQKTEVKEAEKKIDEEAEKKKVAEAARKKKELEEFIAATGEANVQIIDPDDKSFGLVDHMQKEAVADNVDSNGKEVAPTTSAWGTPAAGSWGEPNPDSGGGWGDDDGGIWSTGGGTDAKDWMAEKEDSLMEFLGPTVIPITHTTGVIERSTRQIVKVVPPPEPRSGPGKKKGKGKGKVAAEVVEEELEKRFGYMVLAPWKKVGNHERSDIQSPVILPDSRGPVINKAEDTLADQGNAESEKSNSAHHHDPAKDEIIVLIEKNTADKIVLGLGLGATWIQIVRKDLSAVEEDGEDNKKNGKKGGPGVNGEPTKYWYMEQLMSTVPSFHTDRHYDNQLGP